MRRQALIFAYGVLGVAVIAAFCGGLLLCGYVLRLLGVPHDLAYGLALLWPIPAVIVYWVGYVLTDYGDAVRR